MKVIITILFVVCTFSFAVSSIVFATEDKAGKWDHSYQLHEEVKPLVQEKKFKTLEDLVKLTRRERLRYKNSDWVLPDLYNAIPNSMPTYERIYEFADEWKKSSPKSNIPYVIEARAFLARAWEIRGNAFMGQLSQHEYGGFKEYLNKSWNSILEAERKGPVDPEIYKVKTELSFLLYSDKSLAKKNFDECLKLEIGYYPAYFIMLNYLQPKWSGSNEELLEFVQKSSDATRHIDGNGLYSLLVYSLSNNTNDIFSGEGGNFSWARTKSGFQDMMSKYGKSPDVLHKYGFLAMLAKDYEAFSDVLAETGTEWDELKDRYYRSKRWYESRLKRAKKYLNNK